MLKTMDEGQALQTRLAIDLREAEEKAFDALRRYKFQMFGYWAAIWVHLNRVGGFKQPNPFKPFVQLARQSENSTEQVVRKIAEEDAAERALESTQFGPGA